jgi:hypothetical protein
MGLLDALNVDQTLIAVEVAMMHLQVRTGPHAVNRPFISKGQRDALARIRETAAAALFESVMPSDPEEGE